MVKIITPYINSNNIGKHYADFIDLDIHYEKDDNGIGPDLMFQQIWNKYPKDDIFILHADMFPYYETWFDDVLKYVEEFPEAGMFGCLLLYPTTVDNKEVIQCAGGKFTDGRPDHFGSGLEVKTGQIFKNLEFNENQYDNVREVAWTTFGGCYLRRSFINSVGSFSTEYEWAYNRDVDFCLSARSSGQKIYQIPVKLYHYESLDAKVVKMQQPDKVQKEFNNLKVLKAKWQNTEYYKTINSVIKHGY